MSGTTSISVTFERIMQSKILTGILVAFIVAIGGYLLFHRSPTYQFVTVKRGAITESVSLTGNTVPVKSVSLGFGSSGVISRTYSDLGKKVYAGQVLAQLNTNDLVAGVRSAEATVDAQQAKLDGLLAGTRPEDVAISQAALDESKQDLTNIYSGIGDSLIDSYAKANDAVRTQIDALFSGGDSSSPKLAYTTANSQAQIDSENERSVVSKMLNTWQVELASIDKSIATLETLLSNEISYLATIRQLFNNLSKTLEVAPGLSTSNLATYKTNLSTATSEVNAATKNLNTISQNIASQKTTISQLQAQLDLKRAGTLPTDISAQQAQVKQAKASLDSARAKLLNAQIIAPITGVITQFDAKVGQQASLGTALISMMSDTGYEVDAGVSETDVGKVSVDDNVTMTLDAFPSETFTGSVFYIAPAQTNIQGVITYQTKISFDTIDARLKGGLTANINIQTMHKDDALILPQYAILQNDQGTFAQKLSGGAVTTHPVTLGIADQSGNVEVLSGVIEGEQVLNIGLKAQ